MRSLPFVCALAIVVSGCVVERDYSSPDRAEFSGFDNNDVEENWEEDQWQDEEFEEYGTLPVIGGRVSGDIGAVRDFDAPTDYVDSYGDSSWMTITLNATDSNGRVGMLILEVSNLDIQNTPAGTYNYSISNVDGPADGEIWVTGCSSSDDSYYDAPAEGGVVVVQDNPDGTRDISIEAELPSDTGGTSLAQAQFTLE